MPTTAGTQQEQPATTRQVEVLRSIVAEKALFGSDLTREETTARLDALIAEGITKQDASRLIGGSYRARPHRTAKDPVPLHAISGIDGLTVPEGCYAVEIADSLRFYRVYFPTSGEHEGTPVIRRYASEATLGLYTDEARAALHAIDANLDAAAFRFADEYTRCYVCTRLLTDPLSRLLSIGPDCRGFTGHRQLKSTAHAVDTDKTRRGVYRALRAWAVSRGFVDPRSREDRLAHSSRDYTAVRIAAAWSALPGVLALNPDEAVTLVQRALDGDDSDDVLTLARDAAPDAALEIINSGALSAPLLTLFSEHSNRKVRDAAAEYLMALLSA